MDWVKGKLRRIIQTILRYPFWSIRFHQSLNSFLLSIDALEALTVGVISLIDYEDTVHVVTFAFLFGYLKKYSCGKHTMFPTVQKYCAWKVLCSHIGRLSSIINNNFGIYSNKKFKIQKYDPHGYRFFQLGNLGVKRLRSSCFSELLYRTLCLSLFLVDF